MALRTIVRPLENAIPIWWNYGEEWPSAGGENRFNFYEGTASPYDVFGGTEQLIQFECMSHNNITSAIEIVEAIPSPMEINLGFVDNDGNYDVTANVILTGAVSTTNNKIFFLITCDSLRYDITTIGRADSEWSYRVLAVSDPVEFTQTAIGEQGTYTHTFTDIETFDFIDEEELQAIAVVQSYDTKEILQGQRVIYGTVVEASENEISPTISLNLTNYPNPFNPSTTISFSLITEINENTELVIYNLKGQKVKDLSPSLCHAEPVEVRGEKKYNAVWNGTDDNNISVSSGIYLYKLESGNYSSTKKMIMLK